MVKSGAGGVLMNNESTEADPSWQQLGHSAQLQVESWDQRWCRGGAEVVRLVTADPILQQRLQQLQVSNWTPHCRRRDTRNQQHPE